MNLYYDTFDCPIRTVLAAVDESGAVARVEFLAADDENRIAACLPPSARPIKDRKKTAAVRRQLQQYFAGHRCSFDLPLSLHGTEFQRLVWRELSLIPYGETRTYGQVAAAVGRPKASRAVGRAIGTNPIPVIVPCHRVIGADGSLTGFACGLEVKRFLLGLEGWGVKG